MPWSCDTERISLKRLSLLLTKIHLEGSILILVLLINLENAFSLLGQSSTVLLSSGLSLTIHNMSLLASTAGIY